MIKLRNKFQSEENKRLLSNFLSLTVLQGANYILPLLTFPYLVRVLGVENFGLLAFATAFIGYFNILTDYGFNLSATKDISIHRNNQEKMIEIFNSVMIIKGLLLLFSLFILTIFVIFVDKFHQHIWLYYASFGIVIGQAMFPTWFFQGIEKMRYITYLNIISKIIFTISIFIFVKESQDYIFVPILTSFGFIIVGIWSLFIIKKDFEMQFKLQNFNTIKYYLVEGWSIFISRIFVSLYTTTNTILLGFLTTNTIVGYYAIAEKIINAVSGLFFMANQAIYPHMATLLKQGKDKFNSFLKNIIKIYLASSLILFILLIMFGKEILILIKGNYIADLNSIFIILSFLIVLIPYGGLFTQVLIIENRKKEFQDIVKKTFIFNMILAPVMIYFLQGYGLALSVVTVQIYVIVLNLQRIFYK
jgi:PST family polysaccharide transporter